MLETGKMTATTGEAISAYLRVYVSTGAATVDVPPTISIAGLVEDDIGVIQRNAASGDEVAVEMYNKPGTQLFKAAGAISGGALFYRAASGKVSATAAGAPLGRAVTPASGDGAVFEGQVFAQDIHTPRKITDPGNAGAISVATSGVCSLTSGGVGHTRTLAAPTFDGQRIVLAHDVDGGTVVITVAGVINETGNNTITLTDVDESIELVAVRKAGALRWQAIANVGATLSTV